MYRDGVYRNTDPVGGDPYRVNYDGDDGNAAYEYISPGIIEGEPGRKNSGVPKPQDRSRKPECGSPPRDKSQQHGNAKHHKKDKNGQRNTQYDERKNEAEQSTQGQQETLPKEALGVATDIPSRPYQDGLSQISPDQSWSEDDFVSGTSGDVSPKNTSHSNNSSSAKNRTPTAVLQKGYREARHFAGGVIHHPTESTKHYSILRHSHGLVFYQGTSTSVTISVFADRSLPRDRTFWLRPKSWSGSVANRQDIRQETDRLIDVTPTVGVKADQVNPSDERAWQRDILQFEKKTLKGPRSEHLIRETVVIRVPTEAGDGYFQVLLCSGGRDKPLCASPVFRMLSVSPSMGVVSGSNWATLPLEMGAMALSMQAQRTVGAAILPVKMAAKSKTAPYMPSRATEAQMAGKLAWGAAGAANRVTAQIDDLKGRYDEQRQGHFTPAFKIDDDYENGPKEPYPIAFTARCVPYTPIVTEPHILPVAALVNLPEAAEYKLWGYYFGWCSTATVPAVKHAQTKQSQPWFQTIICVSPVDIDNLDRVTMSRANQKHVKIQILADGDKQLPNNGEVNVEVLGCIRPWDQELESLLINDMRAGEEVAYETAFINEMSDITLAQKILDHPAWGPGASAQHDIDAEVMPKMRGMDRMKQELAQKRLAVQKKIDQVPLHKVGVRMPVDRMKDKAIVINGYFIDR